MKITKDFLIVRGDPTQLSLPINDDYTAQRLIFVVKADKVLTSARLIEKKNVAAGGSNTQLKATANGGLTNIKIFLDKTDSQDFTTTTYYWDLTAQPADLSTDPVTLAGGELEIDFDVQTDFDNTDLPADAERYIAILASAFNNNDFIKVSVVNGVKTYIGAATYTKTEADLLLAAKVDKVTGYSLTKNDLTDILKSNYDSAYGWGNHASASYILTSSKGAANGVVPLNALSLIDSQYLPGYVDDIIEVANYASLPVAGSTGVIYITLDDNYTYRWGGAVYVNVSNPHSHSNKSILDGTQESFTTALKSTYDGYATSKIGLTALSSTATGLTYTNTTGVFSLTSGYVIPTTTQETNWGAAYSHVSLTNNPHSVTASQVGLGNVTNESKATMFTSPTFTGTVNGAAALTVGSSLFITGQTAPASGIGGAMYSDGSAFFVRGYNYTTPAWRPVYLDASTLILNHYSTGEVLIGSETDRGDYKLQVTGVTVLATAQNTTAGEFTAPFLRLAPTSTTNTTGFTGISYGTSTSDNFGWTAGARRTGGDAASGSFVFNFHNNTAQGTELFRIASTGFVGVGYTSDPTSGNKFAVNGASYFNGDITQYGNITSDGKVTALEFLLASYIRTSYKTNSSAAIYSSKNNSAAYPFNEDGNMIIQGKSTNSIPRDIIFRAGSDGTYYDNLILKRGGTATFGGQILASANNTLDIGTTTTKFRSGYFGTDIYNDGNLIQSQTSYHYYGTATSDGSFRTYINGSGELVTEKRISGTWTLLHTIA
jgi:hypothetical protein